MNRSTKRWTNVLHLYSKKNSLPNVLCQKKWSPTTHKTCLTTEIIITKNSQWMRIVQFILSWYSFSSKSTSIWFFLLLFSLSPPPTRYIVWLCQECRCINVIPKKKKKEFTFNGNETYIPLKFLLHSFFRWCYLNSLFHQPSSFSANNVPETFAKT